MEQRHKNLRLRLILCLFNVQSEKYWNRLYIYICCILLLNIIMPKTADIFLNSEMYKMSIYRRRKKIWVIQNYSYDTVLIEFSCLNLTQRCIKFPVTGYSSPSKFFKSWFSSPYTFSPIDIPPNILNIIRKMILLPLILPHSHKILPQQTWLTYSPRREKKELYTPLTWLEYIKLLVFIIDL